MSNQQRPCQYVVLPTLGLAVLLPGCATLSDRLVCKADEYSTEQIHQMNKGLCPPRMTIPMVRQAKATDRLESIGPLTSGQNGCLMAAAVQPLKQLRAEYKHRHGKELRVASAYRSVKRQAELIRGYVEEKMSWAEIYSYTAPLGYSDHHTGLAVDFISAEHKHIEQHLASFLWLANNAYKYGFELRYPHCDRSKNEGEFGQEPWHYLWKGPAAEFVALEECANHRVPTID